MLFHKPFCIIVSIKLPSQPVHTGRVRRGGVVAYYASSGIKQRREPTYVYEIEGA